MRIESSQDVKGGGWLHKLSEPLPQREPPREEPEPTREQLTRLAMDLANGCDLARDELAGKLGVASAALYMLGVGYGSEDTRRGERRWFWTFPERTGQLKVTGILRRYRDGAKFHMKGGKRGLYVIEGWWRPTGPVFLVEGGSDTAALLTMGLCVLGRPSNIGGVNLLIGMLRSQTARPIVVVAERDEKPERRGKVKGCGDDCRGCFNCFPGLAGAVQTAGALENALGRDVAWRFPPDDAKDSREWLNRQTNRDNLRGRYIAALTRAESAELTKGRA